MEMIATAALQSGKIIAEDVVNAGQVIVTKDTTVNLEIIKKLQMFGVIAVCCYEPKDFATSYYESVKLSREFAKWQAAYNNNLVAYKVAVDSFVYNKVRFSTDDLLTIAYNLVPDKMTGRTLLTYINLMRPAEDELSYAHGMNVALICRVFGRWLGFSSDDIDTLTLCGFIYDVGKNILPQDIIWKNGKLLPMEFDLMKTHAFHAYHLLSKAKLNEHILNATLQHHERCDGSGYPQGLKADEIDPYAKIIAIVDMYEAITAPRTYREPMCPYKAMAIFEQDFFQKYDIKFIQTFMQHISEELIGNKVRLNTGDVGEVKMVNKTSYSRPLLQMEDGTMIDLTKFPQLSIEEIIS